MKLKFRSVPYNHQRDILQASVEPRYFGYFMEPGTGKTKVTLDLSGELWLRDEIDCVVIVAPNGVHEQWIDEQIPLHLGLNVDHRALIYRSGGGEAFKREANRIVSLARKNEQLLFVSFNIESVNTDRGFGFIEWLLQEFRCLLVLDESTKIRNPKAQRTKALVELAPKARYRRILSGTPLVRGYENLWSQFQFLSPEILNCRTFTGFKSLYCRVKAMPVTRVTPEEQARGMRPRMVKMIVGYQNVRRLMSLIDPHIRVIKKSDCLDLPDKIYSRVSIPFTDEQAKAYESMREELFVRLERELPELDVLAKVKAVAAARMKLRQISIGFILDENKDAHPIKTHRFSRLLEDIDEAPGKVIVWSSFIYSLQLIEQTLQKADVPYVRYSRGNMSALADFKSSSTLKVFVANPQSAGIGLNLAEADTMIFVNDIDDPEMRWQAEDRAHRIGQTKHLNILDYFTKGTVETKIPMMRSKRVSMKDVIMNGSWRDLI